uniref:chitin synthase n=1 Tax=Wuchereria bancrofti TaxID=6293 RepID=A0AAF5PX20_WUCBA
MISNKITNKRIFNEKDSKYTYIPINANDEPTLISYAGRYNKNETRSRQSSGGSQTIISHTANKQKIDRPNSNSNSWATVPRGWDVFRLLPPPPDNLNRGFWYDVSLQVLKITCFCVLFILTLLSAIISKATFLLMTSAIGTIKMNVTICNDKIPESPINQMEILPIHVVKWIWAVYISLCIPELQCFIGSIHRAFFRNVKKPTFAQFITVFVVETLNAIGVGILAFKILPNLDAITGAMLTNFACFVPSILLLLSRRPNRLAVLLMAIDALCIIVQIIALWTIPDLNVSLQKFKIILPFCLILISLGWWQNFVHIESALAPIRALARFAVTLNERRSKTYILISIWKCIVYLLMVFLVLTNNLTSKDLFENDPFGEKLQTITARNLNQTQINKFYERMKIEIAKNENGEMSSVNALKFAGMQMMKPSLVLKSYRNRNLINQWNNHNSQFFPDQSQSVQHKSPALSPILSTTIQPFQPQKINKYNNDHSMIPYSTAIDNNFESNESSQNSFREEFEKFTKNRQKRTIDDDDEYEIPPNTYNIYDDYVELNQYTTSFDALWIVLIQAIAVILTYHTSKFACKVMLQRTCFALPVVLSVPATVAVLLVMCRKRYIDPCHLTNFFPKELFWRCNTAKNLLEFFLLPLTQIWFAILMVQLWITLHLWRPRHERLAKTAKLFILPYNSALFTDQCLALNRRCDDKTKIRTEDLDFDTEDFSTRNINSGLTYIKPTASSLSSDSASKVIETAMIKEMASSADAVTKIYVCATMWHETALEMTCMLKSIFRLDEDQCARRNAQKYLKIIDPDYYEFEAHIFFDDAFEINEYGEPVINKFVQQLIEKIDEAASALHQTQMKLKAPKKISTPYGGRLSFIMPGKNRLMIHLKDKQKIRVRKRWSQVMYLYYLLGYQLMMKVDDEMRKEIISENTFILTLDGDVDFSPQCVHLLIDLMKKDRRLGAACGRIHPRGTGLMIWYQKFEYAIGHWLQKATEHMIGCVLCSPGCFSLFRSLALMDDNVTRRYASKAENPVDFIQYDQGEDRWLCTLLLQRGYRVEYCAASDALTYAPEGFNEFFNQRRRWIPSTLANIIDLLQDYKNVINVNESISIWYILYQCIMLTSSILGPGTIFLMVVGALSISFNIDTSLSLFIVTLPVASFCFMCFISDSEKQLMAAQIIGALFAMLMTAVIVGTVIQMQKDGIMSPHSIFLLFVIGSFFTAAILHPLEFTCITPGILYFLAIPCMYMLLPIYSLCNLNNIAWGTRENPKVEGNDPIRQKRPKHIDLISNNAVNEVDGEIAIGCGAACRLMCCLKDKSAETAQIWQLSGKVNEMMDKLDHIELQSTGMPISTRIVHAIAPANNSELAKWENNSIKEDQTDIEDDRDITDQSAAAMRNRKWNSKISEVWLNDKCIRGAEKDCLDPDEEIFWNDVINKYLTPIIHNQLEQKNIRDGLMLLRNKVCSGFFMVNIVFIIIVLLLQLQKDCIHIEWPLGPRYNHTIIPCNTDIREPIWVVTRLQLEPIGLVFLLFFMSILIIQFIGMLLHRFGTMAHIIASTQLFCWRKRVDHLTEDELVVQNAVEIARELQAIRGVDEPDENAPSEEQAISRRNIVRNLESSKRSMYRPKTETLDAAFRKRFFALSINKAVDRSNSERRLTLRRNTIRAIERRRNSIFGNQQPNEDEAVSLVADRRQITNDKNFNTTRRSNLLHLFDNPLSRT